MFFISQYGKNDCAFTCMNILLANLNKDRNYLFLPHEDRGYSFKEIIEEAKTHGLELLGVSINDSKELLKCKVFPIIVTLKGSSNTKHSVIVLKTNEKYITIFDPSLGKRKMDFDSFIERWTGKALIVSKHTKTVCEITPEPCLEKKDKFASSALQFMSGISLILGTYFLDSDKPYFLPIFFFVLFVIFEISFRYTMMNNLQKININIYSKEPSIKNIGYGELYSIIQKYEVGAIALLPNLIFSISVVIFMTVILLMNNVMNAVYVVSAISFGCVEFFAFNPFMRNKENEILDCENKIVNATTKEEFKTNAKIACDIAYKVGLEKTIFKYSGIAFLFIVSIVMMKMTNTINITYLVFYSCVTIYLSSNMVKILDFSIQRDNFDSLEAKIRNYLKD